MRRLIMSAVLLAACGFSTAAAADGVEFNVSVQQETADGPLLVMSDTFTVREGMPTTGFLLAFSIDLTLESIDSARCNFLTHLVTIGPPANTYGRSFSVEYGLPARIDGIEVKGDATYSLALTPLEPVEVNDDYCPYDHNEDGGFSNQPTANFDVQVLPNSFADFFFESAKSVLEADYREFKAAFSFNLPGKFNVFLAPCPMPSVIWDERYGQVVDPTRSTTYSILAKGINTTDPFVVNHLAVLRSWGYAPPFVSEGAANFIALPSFEMKEYFAENAAIPLDSLLDTYAYLNADPLIADRTSATFVKYLITEHGIGRFKDLYAQSHDSNLRQKLEEVYHTSIADLEAGWREYVDTVTISYTRLAEEAARAETMFNFERMRDFSQAMIERAPGVIDSAYSLGVLKRSLFFLGDYYDAADVAEMHVDIQRDVARNWMAWAAYQMMNGEYDASRENFLNALAVDSSDQMIKFNLSINYLSVGDTTTAEFLLVEIVSHPTDAVAQAESRVLLGHLLMGRDNPTDSAQAVKYFGMSVQAFQQSLQVNPNLAAPYLWMGIAAIGLNDHVTAQSSLETAHFLEMRPFYLGMINLWLGKLMDVKGEREVAREFYGEVLAGSSADYHQQEARQYLENPYSL